MASCRDPRLACLRQVGKKRAAGVAGPAARLSSSRVDRLAQPISYSGAKLFQPYFMNCFNCASPAVPIAIPPFRLKRQGKLVVARTRDGGKSCNGSDFRGAHPTGVRHANSGIYQGGRHVVNRAHRRTISAAPKRCPSRGAIPTLDVAQGLFGEPWQIHLRPHTTSMSAIIAAFVSGLERRRWGRHRRHHSRSL